MQWNGASRFEFIGHSMETETTWSESPNGGKATAEQTPASEEINKSKREGLWESQSGIQAGKSTIWVRSFEIKNYNRVHQVYQFHQTTKVSNYHTFVFTSILKTFILVHYIADYHEDGLIQKRWFHFSIPRNPQISRMESFATIVNNLKPLLLLQKSPS